MADRDPKELHEAQTFETVEVANAEQAATKAKRKKLFAGACRRRRADRRRLLRLRRSDRSKHAVDGQRLCRRRRRAGHAAGRRRRSRECSSRTRSRCAAATCWCGSTIPTRGSRSPTPKPISRRRPRKVRGTFATDSGLGAQIARASRRRGPRASAQIAAAQADVEKARIDLQRREALAASGAVSGDELTNAPQRLQYRGGQPRARPRPRGPRHPPRAAPRSETATRTSR